MRVHLESLEQMRTFAAALAEHLRAGDLLILTGNLGAGKTTFTQSLGKTLDVAGRITSPTFVIAREHPSRTGGPALVHVDAYRLADGEELEDLDLDSELDESITVVEWGAGMAEQLSSDHLDITITPVWDEIAEGGKADGEPVGANDEDEPEDEPGDAPEDEPEDAPEDEPEAERRTVDLTGRGAAWAERMPAVEAAVSALAGVRVDDLSPADLPAEDFANEGDES
ncbi:tRNA (adenosine(37)-N6)-threonylcarbamoyltransferase complex ATPase subunit type 1 TsaE [Brevibacterium linens]|uniref:tRNA threonylcarbamoyladenosine biosynthesis protein TsaE n=1 Tax=Brevibacterium linens TaxID=1703 RepID=A0A2H1IE33_BRELN|nr:tRNA (adenosine(37)-N6)-threonylcarbamoyltransferase complex ATPase subunit type 1 TsaE [Brevibacterium linens]AZU01479.1 tRNA (adenosine(37)-N6)-threonylcarbamoyltransferase complex ATPase subunit type 1 TsaE [Brevibacterium linens]SMX73453.1 Threonylcarbamoyl adenosine biosynthesis protein TsaE [Brevibacterium linens]